jgi:GNAT superfamily N-acetyltransferase
MSFLVRLAAKEDAAAITHLTRQLGYPATESDTLQNLSIILEKNNEAVFVATQDNKVIGWIGVFTTIHLASGPSCEILGLVVDTMHHRKGVGKKLLEEARDWARQQGHQLLRVRANVKRKEAHKFYNRMGFKETKEQKILNLRYRNQSSSSVSWMYNCSRAMSNK